MLNGAGLLSGGFYKAEAREGEALGAGGAARLQHWGMMGWLQVREFVLRGKFRAQWTNPSVALVEVTEW